LKKLLTTAGIWMIVGFFVMATAPGRAGAVGIFKKDVAGRTLKLNLFGFSQMTAETGDGLMKKETNTDNGLRFGADRVRLGYKVKWGKVFSKLQVDFNKTDSSNVGLLPQIIKDAVVGYKFNKAAKVQVGMFKTPVGMDFNISGKKLDITKRGMEKKLVLERSLGAMLSGRNIGGTGLGYDIGYFNPTTRSSVVSAGTKGDDAAYAARIHYDMGKTLHAEASFGKSQNAGGANTEDYKVWDAAAAYHIQHLTLKGEYIDGSNLKGTKDKDQKVWYLHAGYRFTPMLEGVVRYYSGKEDLNDTNLTNTFVGLNIYLLPKKKESARIQLNYVFTGGDEWNTKVTGGYKDNVVLAQFQVSF